MAPEDGKTTPAQTTAEKFGIDNLFVTPNAEQIRSFLFIVIPTLTAWLVGRGYITADTASAIWNLIATNLAIIVSIVSIAWAWLRNRRAKLIERAAAQPNTVVITDSKTAAASPSPDVIDVARAKRTIDTVVAQKVQ